MKTLRRVAITGGTSLTALWYARAFLVDGWDVTVLCRRSESDYTSTKRARLEHLKGICPVLFSIPAETGEMARWIQENPITVWIHHHHLVENYRSGQYDEDYSLRVGVDPVPEILASLKRWGGFKGILFSGSMFEPSYYNRSLEEVSAYCRTKELAWKMVEAEALRQSLPISKIVMPDVIGPLESPDRLIPVLLRAAKERREFFIWGPKSISDHIPAKVLAKRYVKAANELLEGKTVTCRNSGWIGSTEDWVKFVCKELVAKRLGMDIPEIKIVNPDQFTIFHNSIKEKEDIDWDSFWDEYADYERSGSIERALFSVL